MIRNIHAVAIDDNKEELSAILKAATQANISCKSLHFPAEITDALSDELCDQQIRLVICDYHLQAHGAMGGASSNNSTIGGILEKLGIRAWTPYVLLLWSRDANDEKLVEGLKNYLETRVNPQYLPCAIVPFQKSKYGIPGIPTQEQSDALWKDLQTKILESRGVKLLLQLEAELHRAAGQVACKLVETARGNSKVGNKVTIDDELDTLLSRIARAATSDSFAKEHCRSAAVEGLLPLVSDEMLHLAPSEHELKIWENGLNKATNSAKLDDLTVGPAAALNDALHITQDISANRAERGTVFECTNEQASELFGIKSPSSEIFAIRGTWPSNAVLRCFQVEGACDGARHKKGAMVPILLAVEIDAQQLLLPKGEGKGTRPLAVEETPPFLGGQPKKLVANVKYYTTMERSKLEATLKPVYRLRESLISKLAFAWATHIIRPGIVSFDFGSEGETPAAKS